MKIYCFISLSVAFLFYACGGGNGLGPGEIKKREDRIREELPIDWNNYGGNDFQSAIESFAQTLEEADRLDGIDNIRNQIRSEAQNGIGWSQFRQQDLNQAENAFRIATSLDRNNTDAWVGRTGIALAQQRYGDAVQYAVTAIDRDPDYNSAVRLDPVGRNLGHDNLDIRHVRLALAEAYFQLGRYSAADRPDPNNASAQMQLIRGEFRFQDPGQLLQTMSQTAMDLQSGLNVGF